MNEQWNCNVNHNIFLSITSVILYPWSYIRYVMHTWSCISEETSGIEQSIIQYLYTPLSLYHSLHLSLSTPLYLRLYLFLFRHLIYSHHMQNVWIINRIYTYFILLYLPTHHHLVIYIYSLMKVELLFYHYNKYIKQWDVLYTFW